MALVIKQITKMKHARESEHDYAFDAKLFNLPSKVEVESTIMHVHGIRNNLVFGLARVLTPSFFKEEMQKAYLRPMTYFLKQNYGCGLIGVEVGVQHGFHSRALLENLSIKHLYLVDSYQNYVDGDLKTHHSGLSDYNIAQRTLKEHRDKISFIISDSAQAIPKLPKKIDFVYIDANHSYESVKTDISEYYPIVRKGGVIGGHDFMGWPGVQTAVIEFAWENKLELFVDYPDWWVQK